MIKKTIPTILLGLFLLFLTGCGSVPATYYYRVDSDSSPGQIVNSPIPITLGIAQFDADVVYEEDRIVYRNSPYEVQYYHYRRWVAPPRKMVKDALLEQFRSSGAFQRVVGVPSTEKLDYVLKGKINAFEKWDENDARFGSVGIEFELYHISTGDLVWKAEFSRKTPAAKQEPVEVVKAISESLNKVIAQARGGIDGNLRH